MARKVTIDQALYGSRSVFVVKGETSRALEIEGKDFHEGLNGSDRSGQPDGVSENSNKELNREIMEEVFDFYIPGLPHSTVKQFHGANVRELIQKIENHPHRQALLRDLQQSRQFPSVKSQKN